MNESEADWTGDVAAYYAPAKQTMTIAGVHMKKNDALFLPVNIPLADEMFCRNCQALSKNDKIIYATAELTAVRVFTSWAHAAWAMTRRHPCSISSTSATT